MKTDIYITGQLSSVFALRNAIVTNNCEEKKLFNSITLTFNSRAEAYKALSSGREYLKKNSLHYKYTKKHLLAYDAALATIINPLTKW